MELKSKNETHFCFRQTNYKYCAGNSTDFNASIIWGSGMEFSTRITMLVVFSVSGVLWGWDEKRNESWKKWKMHGLEFLDLLGCLW